jgi:K+-transporting ATPase ATPase A chain
VEPIIQLIAAIGGTLGLSVLFGLYMARMISYESRPIERTLAKVESGFYRLIGIDATKGMTWKRYFIAILVTDVSAGVILFLILTFQNYLPTATPGIAGLAPDLAFHTAVSFMTNTDLQHYNGDQQLTVFSQMVGLTFLMFIAPATAISSGFAFIRAFIRRNFGLGNFYVDMIRVTVTLLLPVSFISSLILIYAGVPQTLQPSLSFNDLEGKPQTITMGPVGSLESIKELGHNGGGYFGANSAHPFENPNGLTNVYEIMLILVIPLAFPIAYGKLVGWGRGISILITMLIGFGLMLGIAFYQPSGPTGLDTRFGNFGSVLFNVASVATNTGAVASALTGMSPAAVTSLFLGMFVQAIPGAAGVGMMTMMMYVILSLFIVGLMVGKTPEFMSMKISSKDVKLAVFIFLLHPALILIPTALAFTTGNAQAVTSSPNNKVSAIAYTEVLYEFTSSAANNGSDYLGTSANTLFFNWSTGLVMFIGRFAPLGLMMALAGSFTTKERKEAPEPIKTQGPLFITVLLIMTFLLTALTFFPFIVIGPFSL